MPRTETTTRELFKFDELSDDAKDKALEELRYINVEHLEWWDGVENMALEAGDILGIDIDKIYFSGFWSQGDGACFVGSYAYKKGAAKDIRTEFSYAEELHAIADALQDIQRRSFYRLSATVRHSGRYSHEYSTDIDVYDESGGHAPAEVAEEIADTLRDFMRWIYKSLENEYEYLTSDEAVRESIEANEYEFTEEGDLA